MKTLSEYRKYWFSIILALTLMLPAVISVAINLSSDPFEIFTQDSEASPAFLGGRGQDRYQHAGVIRQYQPRSVIIGHSHAANFLPTSVESTLNWKEVYSLTLDGGPPYEHNQIIEFALKNSALENVLWLFEPQNLAAAPTFTNPKMPFPEYLYDTSRMNDLTLFATLPKEFAKYVSLKDEKRTSITQEIELSGRTVDPRDRSTSWYHSEISRFNRPNEVAKLILGKSMKTFEKVTNPGAMWELNEEKIDRLVISDLVNFDSNIDRNFLSPVLKHPEVNFTFIALPPFPTLFWKTRKLTRESGYKQDLAYIRAFVKKVAPYKNVEVYGFGTDMFTNDLRLYKDNKHYHIAVNEFMLNAISQKTNKLTTENIDKYLVEFDRAINTYSLPKKSYPKKQVRKNRKELNIAEATTIIASYKN